jgi:chromosome segregation ATPase
MGCSLLSIVEILFYFLLVIRSTLVKISRIGNKQAPLKSTSNVIQVISAKMQDPGQIMLEAIKELKRTVEAMDKQNQRKFQELNEKVDGQFAKIEERFEKLEKKVSENLIFEDY